MVYRYRHEPSDDIRTLVHSQVPLTNSELKFIRSYLQMTTTAFGKLFGVSHVAVLKWESGKNRISPPLEFCIRMHILDHLQAKDKEFRLLYKEINLEQLSKEPKEKINPLAIDTTSDEWKIAL
jgi:DNA-binding XRE family transcriptional regulator